MVLCIQWLLNLAGVGLVVGGLNFTIFPTNDMCQREPLDVCITDIETQQTCLCSGKLNMHICCTLGMCSSVSFFYLHAVK